MTKRKEPELDPREQFKKFWKLRRNLVPKKTLNQSIVPTGAWLEK